MVFSLISLSIDAYGDIYLTSLNHILFRGPLYFLIYERFHVIILFLLRNVDGVRYQGYAVDRCLVSDLSHPSDVSISSLEKMEYTTG